MNQPAQRPNDVLNAEDTNLTQNPHFNAIVNCRLCRRYMVSGGVGSVVMGSLGFAAIGKCLADAVVAPGYQIQVLCALGDPLTADTPAYKNEGTKTAHDRRAGDYHDGTEWFGLHAQGKCSESSNMRALLATNHEATTGEKSSSVFLHADGGATKLPQPAAEVDNDLAIHGVSVVWIGSMDKQWSYKASSAVNRWITTMTEVALHGRYWQPRQVHQPLAGQCRLRCRSAPALSHHCDHQNRRWRDRQLNKH
jgi:secreted PhoX family phosphatase